MQTAAHYRMASADEVGGDFYDVFPLGDDRWGFSSAMCPAKASKPPP
jgi:serine phosphatase RsbU (regulator of sigma subunit)